MPGQIDDYAGTAPSVIAPSSDGAAITPANDVLLGRIPKAIHNAGTAGTVAVKFSAAGSVVTIYMVQGDTQYIRPAIVMATGTTASALVALY